MTVHLFYINVNDYVIADTVFGSPVLWVSEKIFMNANRMGALKLPTGQNLSLLFCFQSGDAMNKIPNWGVGLISILLVCDACVFHATVFGEIKSFAVLWFLV